MAISFTGSPYYDDFDPSKNYHRILFKPGYAVQSRELTQLQTSLQNQISSFADNIFAGNTPVSRGKVTVNLKCYYLTLAAQYNGVDVVASDFKNRIITNATGTVLAKVIATAEATGSDGGAGDPPTLIISYFSGGEFGDATQIFPTDGSNYTALTSGTAGGTTCTGLSSVASISDGVFYVRNGFYTSKTQNDDGTFTKYAIGNFVAVQPQTTILNKYSDTPSFRIGLNITETVSDYIDDPSLLDPAIGASNYQAPGADRYTIILSLITLPLEPGNDDGFIELVRVNNGIIVKQVDETVYATIDDYFAKRTFDTNGDFIVNDFALGTTPNATNSAKYDVKIGKGVAYVRGYRIENQSDLVLTNDRSRTTETVNNNSVYTDYGSYFYVDTVKGVFDVTAGQAVDLHIVSAANVVSTNATTYSSTLVGKGYIRNLVYDRNTNANTSSYVYKSYVYSIAGNTLSGNASSATTASITFYDRTGKFSATTNAYSGVILTIDSGAGVGYTGTISSYTGSTKTASVTPAFTIAPDSSSVFSLRFGTKDVETIVSTTPGTYTLVANSNINTTTGKVGGVVTGDTNYNNTQAPELIYPIGNPYIATISDSSYSSTKVFRNKAFSGSGTVSLALTLPVGIQNTVDFAGGTGTLSTDAVKRNYTVIVTSTTDTANNGTVGSIMDFATSGNTVVISGDKNTVTFSSTKYKTPLTVTVISNVNITNADDTTSIQRTKTLVTGNTSVVSYAGPDGIINSSTYVDLTKGQVYIKKAGLVGYNLPQSLYVTDLKKITKIIDTGAAGTVPTDSMLTGSANDITNYFAFNNGQKDTFYDHAFLTLRPGAPKPKGNILVVFDYYSHSSADGYFSVESYTNESYGQIPTFVATNGNSYNLRDCLDFRPSRINATATYGLETSAPIASSDAGTYIPQDLTNWTSDYSFYYGRKDKLVLTKDKNFQIIQGNPATNPIFPTKPDGALEIANLTNDPYTTYLPSEAPRGTTPNLSIERVRHRRWTMNDISTLQNQVNNIEYYTTLNLLEQNANNLQVADSRGLNRFKNGIVVDNFSSTIVADTASLDFNAAIDRVAQQMTASQDVTNYALQSEDTVKALGQISTDPSVLGYKVHTIGKSTNIFTLPYSNTAIIEQKLASGTINLNPFTSPVYQGVCYLNPPMDNWVDTRKIPDELLVDETTQVSQPADGLNSLKVNNWQSVPSTLVPTASQTAKTTGTSTTTQTQQTTQGAYTNLGTSYDNVNGYIKDTSVQPYIRKQSLLFRAKALKVNTPIKTFFDGVNVDDYITNPDIIELTNVTGTFKEDDIVGYKDSSGNFYPIAIVASVQKTIGTNNVRLYVCSQVFTTFRDYTNTIYNAKFNTQGQYVSSSAYGTSGTEQPITINLSGKISAVGGAFTDAASQSVILYRKQSPVNWNAFLSTYGVWSNGGGKNPFDVSLTINIEKAGTYTFQGMFDDLGKVYVDGVELINGASYNTLYTQTKALTVGNHTVRITGTNTSENLYRHAAVAVTIKDSAGKMIFNTSQYPLTAVPANSGVATSMIGGGTYYTGATKIVLTSVASSSNTIYVGCKVRVTSTFVATETLYLPNSRSNGSSNDTTTYKSQTTNTYTATITAYDGETKVATLDTPINVSIGKNTLAGGSIDSTYSISGTKNSYKLTLTEGGVAKLSTDEKGNFVGIFDIPEGMFKTGERIFRVDNRTTDGDPGSATTWAESTFYATGISAKSLSTNFASSVYSARQNFAQTNVQNLVNTTTVANPLDPVAQAFNVNGTEYPNGVFINSVKFFFQSKPTTTDIPVTLSIVGTQNGYPNGETLDHSIVTLEPSQVNVSSEPHYLNPTTWTEFTFEAPIYIQPNTLYAFVLQSASQDYSAYVAAKTATAIASSAKAKPTDPTPSTITKIGSAPYIGAFFESQNAITWTADQTKAMMFVVNRCVFDKTKVPKIRFVVPKYIPDRKDGIKGIQGYYSSDLSDNVQGIYTEQDVESHAFNISTTDFIPTDTNISYSYVPTLKSTLALDQEKSTVPGKFGCPTFDNIYLNDGSGPRILKANSSNSFILYATLSSTSNTTSPVLSDDGLTLYNVNWSINNLELSNTNIVIVDEGSGYNANTTSVTISSPDVAGGTQAYATANVVAGNVESIYITFSGSGYLATPTYNITDANTTPGTGASAVGISEYSSSGGNGLAAYVTKKTTLATNDSGDLRVFYSAYRPAGTNIYVFYRVQDANDDQAFENGSWQLMTNLNNTGNRFSTTRTNILEFEAAPGLDGVANNQLSYTSTNGTTYATFNQFAIKIVLTTNDKTAVPFLADVRALALPQGTGF